MWEIDRKIPGVWEIDRLNVESLANRVNAIDPYEMVGGRVILGIMNTYDRIYETVKRIPHGQVATYGQIANLTGLFRKARLVGYALFRVAPDADVPWHRVINAKGEISESPFREGNDYLQKALLEAEGISFTSTGKINLAQHQWQPDPSGYPQEFPQEFPQDPKPPSIDR